MKRLLSSRKRYLLPALLLPALLFSAALILPRSAHSSSGSPPESESPGSAAAFASGQEPAAGWLLAEKAGQVAVYSGGKMLFVTDIEPRTLRASDRELLRRGIEADSMEAVLMLIEDLSS
ncbi:MAG: hypothetical protein II784_03405 [Oscillospiraceae bacterium]|nr:hypothetical protein [Oscillospiraceae bacterium]